MYFDGSSGGVCRVGVITKDGIDRDVSLYFYSIQTKIRKCSSLFIGFLFYFSISQVFFAPIDAVPTQTEASPTVTAVRS